MHECHGAMSSGMKLALVDASLLPVLSFDKKPSSIHQGSIGEVRPYIGILLRLSGLPKNYSVFIET